MWAATCEPSPPALWHPGARSRSGGSLHGGVDVTCAVGTMSPPTTWPCCTLSPHAVGPPVLGLKLCLPGRTDHQVLHIPPCQERAGGRWGVSWGHTWGARALGGAPIITYLASRAKAIMPAASGAEAEVPVCLSVHWWCRSVVTCRRRQRLGARAHENPALVHKAPRTQEGTAEHYNRLGG